MSGFATLAELAPQIVVALVIIGAVIVLTRENARLRNGGSPSTREDCEALKAGMQQLSTASDRHDGRLDTLERGQAEQGREQAGIRDDLRELRPLVLEIYDAVTRPSVRPEDKNETEEPDHG